MTMPLTLIDLMVNDWDDDKFFRLIVFVLVLFLTILLDIGVKRIPFILFDSYLWVTLRFIIDLFLLFFSNIIFAGNDFISILTFWISVAFLNFTGWTN